MKQTEIKQLSELLSSPRTPRSQTVIVAINGKKNSKYVIKWALDNFTPKDSPVFKLLHVCVKITSVPTPMGIMPIDHVREDIARAYKQEVEWKTTEMLDLYKGMFLERKVQVDILRIEGDNIADTIANEVAKGYVDKLVIGASSRGGMFRRKVNGPNYSSKISECIPSFCTVYAISKGRLLSVRQSYSETGGSIRDDNSDRSSSSGTFSRTTSLRTDSAVPRDPPRLEQGSASYSQFSHASPASQRSVSSSPRSHALKTITDLTKINPSGSQSLDIMEEESDLPSSSNFSDTLYVSSHVSDLQKQLTHTHLWVSDQVSEAGSDSPSESEIFMNLELEKLRIELRHTRGMYAIAQSETLEASRKLNQMTKSRLEEPGTPKEIHYTDEKTKKMENPEKEIRVGEPGTPMEIYYTDEKAKELVNLEKKIRVDVKREGNHLLQCAPIQMKEIETISPNDAREKENHQDTIFGTMQQYKKFTWEEIVDATSSFSDRFIIGKGANGTVYKCNLHHTIAAVKVLHSRELQSAKQFQQELEVLSRIRHPYLLLLLGACPEQGCLVYEYMENGSLEDRLLRRNNQTPPIPWFDRLRIAWEIASGLVFLHHSKPKQIIHRDLKPANILLDHNFGSKIGDVGLSKMLQSIDAPAISMCANTGLVGTLSYIDPEYQRTGLNSPKSDVYAFGMVLLQLLTAKSTTALTHMVETAVDDDKLMKVLDPDAGQWPLDEAKELAILGLSCAELRRRDRPDLKNHVLPALERLREAADRARDAAHNNISAPPIHFICPLLKEMMNDPCVASDGYTYDRKSIETWLETSDKSPMTNVTLPTKNLIPNFTLLSAISGWKSEQS